MEHPSAQGRKFWRRLNPEWLTPEWVLVLVLVVLVVVLVVLEGTKPRLANPRVGSGTGFGGPGGGSGGPGVVSS